MDWPETLVQTVYILQYIIIVLNMITEPILFEYEKSLLNEHDVGDIIG